MSQKNRTELRKKDFLVVRSTKNQNIVKVITPQTFQVGLDDEEFRSSFIVKGNAIVSGRILDGSGNLYITGSGPVVVTENATGGLTISTTVGQGAVLTQASNAGITSFSYNGTSPATVGLNLYSQTGLEIDGSNGLAINPNNPIELQATPAANDYLLIHDADDSQTRNVKKISVANLMTAAQGGGALQNALVLRDGLGNVSYNNTSTTTVDLEVGVDGGLSIVGGTGTGGAVKVDPNAATETTALSAANDFVLIHQAGQAGGTRKVKPQHFADLASSFSISAGTGLTYSAGSAYNGAANSTLAIDSNYVAVLGNNNTFSGNSTFSGNVLANGGLTGSLQEVSQGVPYLLAGSNVSITTGSNGQVTISASSMSGNGTLTNGSGIGTLSFDGTSSTTIAIDTTNLSSPSVVRDKFVIFSDPSSQSTIGKTTVGDIADLADRTALMGQGTGINITFNGNNNPAVISTKLDPDTLGTDGNGNIAVAKVPFALTGSLGIQAFTYDGAAARNINIDNSVVATLTGSQFSGNVGITGSLGVESKAVFRGGLSGSLTHLADGTPYLREGNLIEITTSSNGSVTISSLVSGPGAPGGGNSDKAAQYLVLSATGSLSNERVFSAGTGINTSDGGSGGTYTVGIRNDVVATLTGSVFSGDVVAQSGLSGSLQMLSDGSTEYIIGAGGVSITTSSNGQVVVSGSVGRVYSAGTGLGLASDIFSIDNSVVATLTGSVFSGDVVAQAGLSGSLQMLSDGVTKYLIGTGAVSIATSSNGQLVVSASSGRIYSAGTGLNLTSDIFTVDNSVVATLTGSVFSGDVIVQSGLSGSLQMLSDGTTPYIIGTGSVSVTTSSSGQLVISSSGGGGAGLTSVAQAGGSTVNNITKLVFTSSTVTTTGDGEVTVEPVIGAPEDGTYTDGLFTGFQYTTPIGTVVDRFNEVLLDLAPSPAPPLDDINSNDTGVTAFLSFGASSATAGYTNVGAGAGFGVAADVNDSYAVSANGTNLRRGIFTLSTVFDGRLNSDVPEARYANNQLNYPDFSFGDGEQGVMLLEVNGSIIHTASLTDPSVGAGNPGSGTYSTLNSNGSGFTSLSVTASAKFNDGSAFNTFKHRTGNWVVAVADQRNGWNYARVVRVINSVTSSITNYVEWVNDSDSSSLTATNNQITAVDVGGLKELSGVKYFKSGSVEYRVDVQNAYRTVYDNNAITFTTTNLSISNISKPTIAGGEDSSKILTLTGSATITDETLLSGSVSAAVNVTHPLKTNLTSGGSTTASGFLLFNVSDNSTATLETFRGESFRMASASFDLQSDVTGGSNDWSSSLHMSGSNTGHTDGLMFYNDLLVAPRNAILNGDFRNTSDGGSLDFAPAGNPNYSGITSGVRTFYRKFQNTTGGSANSYSLSIQGTNTTTLASDSESLGSNKIKVYGKLPNDGTGNTTGWLDLKTLFTSGNYSDGSGGRVFSTPGALNTVTRGTFGTHDIANNDHLMVKILADASWAGDIDQLQVTFANANGTPPPDVNSITSADDGVDAKLSFGATKPISGFTNVTAGAGVGSAANTNDAYDDGSPSAARLGIFDKTTSISGPVNTDSSSGGFADGHTGLLKLEVNGSEISDARIDLTSSFGTNYPGSGTASKVNGNGTGFTNVSTPQPVTGSNNFPDFDEWFRTAKFNVAPADQRNGWNYARVIHTVGGSDRNTNYIEWVNDPFTTVMSFNSIGFGNFGGPTTFYLSGVKYFDNTSTTVTGSLFASVSGSHSNIYSKEANAFSTINLSNLNISSIKFEGTGYTTTQVNSDATVALPTLDTAVSDAQSRDMFVTASYTCSLTDALPEDGLSVNASFRVLHPQKSTLTSPSQSKTNFLIFSASDSSNVNDTENFSGELYRIQSASYNLKSDVTDASNKWSSTADMNSVAGHDNGLLIYDGKLYSPKAKGNSGDFKNVTEGGLYQGPDGNVDYSSLSNSIRAFYRAFRNDSPSDVPEVRINLTGSAEIIPRSGGFASGSIGSNNFIHIDVKIPGQTAWLDLAKAGDTSNNDDGDGCLKGTLNPTINSDGTAVLCSFQGATANGTQGGTPPVGRSDYVVIRVVASENWTGNLDHINIGWST